MTKTLLSLALLAALPTAWAADPAPRAEPGAKPSPAPLDEAQAAAARKELGELRTQMGDLSRRMADLSVKLGDVGPRAYAFRYLSDPDRAMVGVVLSPSPKGARVDALTPDGPAERAGLRSGDIVTEVDGKPLASGGDEAGLADARTRLAELKDGQEVRLAYLRDGKPGKPVTLKAQRREAQNWPRLFVDVDANIEAARATAEADAEARVHVIEARRATARAEGDAARSLADAQRAVRHIEISRLDEARGTPWWGVNLAAVNPDLGHYFGTDRGVLVLSAKEGTAGGLKPGDIIHKVGGDAVGKPEDALRALRDRAGGSDVTLDVLRDRKKLELAMKVPEHMSIFSTTLAPPPAPPAPPSPPTAAPPAPPAAPAAPAAPPAPPKPPVAPDGAISSATRTLAVSMQIAAQGESKGQPALWGGRIKGHAGVGDATCLRVEGFDLDGRGRPDRVFGKKLEFLACPDEPFPRDTYRLGELATFAGHVGDEAPASRRDDPRLVLEVTDVRFWKPMPNANLPSPNPSDDMQSRPPAASTPHVSQPHARRY